MKNITAVSRQNRISGESNARQYLSMFRMRFISGLQYRAAAWAGVCTQFFWGFMMIMTYKAFYDSSAAPQPIEFTQLAQYIWLQQAFLALLAIWFMDSELLDSIKSGLVAYDLCRPYDLYKLWFARLLAKRTAEASLRCLPILLVASFLNAPYNMRLPPDLPAFLTFLFSLCLSAFLVVSLQMLVYVLTFITLDANGIRILLVAAADFLGGAIIPIPLMPDALQKVVAFLPFRYIIDLPLRIYSGNIAGREALILLAVQLFWLVFSTIIGFYSMKKVLRRVVVQGG